jgi:hypothetical protein
MAQDPQGYPVVAWERLSDNTIVCQILSDGTIVLINGTTISSGNGSPEGAVTAPPSSLYLQKDGAANSQLWEKGTGTGNTGWAVIGGGGGGAVSSVFGRTGAVVANANDYSGVTDLALGDNNSSISFTSSNGSIDISDGVGSILELSGNNNAFLSSFVGGTLGIRGATVAIANVGGANTATVTINGHPPVLPGVGIANLQVTDGVSQGLSFGTGSGDVSLTDSTGSDSLVLDGAGTATINGDNIIAIATTKIQLNAPDISIPTLPQVFANNAAALAGGLVSGDVYRTGGDPDTLCIVH